MSNERKGSRTLEECKECEQWADVHNPVRIHGMFTSMLDKMEDRVMDADFKPTTGDLLRVWDAVQTIEEDNRGTEGLKVQWVDLGGTIN